MSIDVLDAKKGIKFIMVNNDTGLEVILSTYGASIYSLKMDLEDMVLTPKNFDDFYNGKYYGLTVGRVAGRIRNGLLKVNDKEYQLEQNEGTNCLHGGPKGICYKKWSYQIVPEKNWTIVRFFLTTKNKEGGFNGKCFYEVTYKLYKDRNVLEINYDAYCKEDTYFALANHSYFNLGHEKDILDHYLKIDASKVSVMDEKDFCIEEFVPIDKNVFNFKEFKQLRKDMNNPVLHSMKWLNGYDHRFLFTNVGLNEPKVSLKSENYRMDIYTDFDAVQIYTGGFNEDIELITGDYNDVFRGIVIECMNSSPEFKNKKEHYKHVVKYSFWRKSDEN